jgi:hypothetical protein
MDRRPDQGGLRQKRKGSEEKHHRQKRGRSRGSVLSPPGLEIPEFVRRMNNSRLHQERSVWRSESIF